MIYIICSNFNSYDMIKKILVILSIWVVLLLVFLFQIFISDKFLGLKVNPSLINICIDFSFILVTIFYIIKFQINPLKVIKKISLKNLLISTIIGVLFSLIYQYVNLCYLYSSIINKEIRFLSKFYYLSMYNYQLYDTLRIVIIVPILEELFYRYILQNKLSEILNPFIAILVSSILFSIGHFDFENFLIFLVSGILLGYSYHYTKNLSISIYIHILINFLLTFTVLSEPITNYYMGVGIIVFIGVIIVKIIGKYKVQLNE